MSPGKELLMEKRIFPNVVTFLVTVRSKILKKGIGAPKAAR
jgi:hypothetical protein